MFLPRFPDQPENQHAQGKYPEQGSDGVQVDTLEDYHIENDRSIGQEESCEAQCTPEEESAATALEPSPQQDSAAESGKCAEDI